MFPAFSISEPRYIVKKLNLKIICFQLNKIQLKSIKVTLIFPETEFCMKEKVPGPNLSFYCSECNHSCKYVILYRVENVY